MVSPIDEYTIGNIYDQGNYQHVAFWQDRKPGLPVPPKPEPSLMRLASTAALDLASSMEVGTQNAEDVLKASWLRSTSIYQLIPESIT